MAFRSLLALLTGLLILSTACLPPAATEGSNEVTPTIVYTPAPTELPQVEPTLIPLPEEERQDSDCPCEARGATDRHHAAINQHSNAAVDAG